MIRSIFVVIVACTVLGTIGVFGLIGAYVGLPRGYFLWAGRVFSRGMLWAGGTPVKVIGLENIDRQNPQVVACNHQSMYDLWAVAANLPVRNHFIGKIEIRKIPIFGRAAERAGHVFIDRGHRVSAVESLKVAGRRIVQDQSTAVVFPEGTRSLNGDLQKFKKGPFVMAIAAGVPMVPTVVHGTFDILPKRGFRLRPQPITLWYGTPVDSSLYTHEDRDAFIVRVHAQMAEMLAQLRAPEGYEGPQMLAAEQVA